MAIFSANYVTTDKGLHAPCLFVLNKTDEDEQGVLGMLFLKQQDEYIDLFSGNLDNISLVYNFENIAKYASKDLTNLDLLGFVYAIGFVRKPLVYYQSVKLSVSESKHKDFYSNLISQLERFRSEPLSDILSEELDNNLKDDFIPYLNKYFN